MKGYVQGRLEAGSVLRLKAVLLDLGDTLVYLDRQWDDVFTENLQALTKYLTGLGADIDVEKFAETFVRVFNDVSNRADLFRVETPMEEIIPKALKKSGIRFTDDMLSKSIAEFYGPEIESWHNFPDTVSTLERLKKDGYPMGLISNAKSDWAVHAILRRRELEGYFKTILTSAAMKIRKPRPEIFRRALNDMGVLASDSVFIGDSMQADVGGANYAGMRSIYLRRKPAGSEAFIKPNASVSSLAEALEVITQWNNGSVSK